MPETEFSALEKEGGDKGDKGDKGRSGDKGRFSVSFCEKETENRPLSPERPLSPGPLSPGPLSPEGGVAASALLRAERPYQQISGKWNRSPSAL